MEDKQTSWRQVEEKLCLARQLTSDAEAGKDIASLPQKFSTVEELLAKALADHSKGNHVVLIIGDGQPPF